MSNNILTVQQITNHALSVLERELGGGRPDYYARRHYGKYSIYIKEGWCVANRLSKQEMENYMKLLKVEE